MCYKMYLESIKWLGGKETKNISKKASGETIIKIEIDRDKT